MFLQVLPVIQKEQMSLKSTEVSHVLQAIRLEDSYAKGTIRISLGKANTEDEVEDIFNALVKIFHI